MGNRVTVEIFGESHSSAIGMTLCGVPAGETIDMDALQNFMDRRAPGRDATATARKEPDRPEFLCGVVDSVTTGAPITAIIHNTDQHSRDYEKLRHVPRPSHADYAAAVKYSGYNDIRGGGAFSGRLHAVAGAEPGEGCFARSCGQLRGSPALYFEDFGPVHPGAERN